ncbi:MAG TPA: hypothetical protein VN040_27830 [Pseudosphingobacterium sp.]|nr:hypothetical protein [Pseudosphingobacterium sp.]
MKNIYVVTSGSNLNADYTINAVFSSQELAQAYINNYGSYKTFNIEVYEKDPTEIDEKETLVAWQCHISEDDHIYCWITKHYNLRAKKIEMCYRKHLDKDSYILVMHFIANSEEDAHKIAKDMATQIRESVGWGNLIEM